VRISLITSFALLGAIALSAPAAAQEKPPLTKEQERQKFHPRRLGMDVRLTIAD
jgi:hypothetical protein